METTLSILRRLACWLGVFWLCGVFTCVHWPVYVGEPCWRRVLAGLAAPLYLPLTFGLGAGNLLCLVAPQMAQWIGGILLLFIMFAPYAGAIVHLVMSLRAKSARWWWILQALLFVCVAFGCYASRFMDILPHPD